MVDDAIPEDEEIAWGCAQDYPELLGRPIWNDTKTPLTEVDCRGAGQLARCHQLSDGCHHCAGSVP